MLAEAQKDARKKTVSATQTREVQLRLALEVPQAVRRVLELCPDLQIPSARTTLRQGGGAQRPLTYCVSPWRIRSQICRMDSQSVSSRSWLVALSKTETDRYGGSSC